MEMQHLNGACPCYLIGIQRDPQAQFGHAVLFEKFEVRAQGHTESPCHILSEPAVVCRIAQAIGLVLAPQEEHLSTTFNIQS